MPFTITYMPDEPILIVRIELPLDKHVPSAVSINAHLTQLTRASSDDLYILIDLREQTSTFSDVLVGMELLDKPDSWIALRRAHPILVGSDPMLEIAIKRFRQQFSVDIVHFAALDDALAYVRAEIAKKWARSRQPISFASTRRR